MDASAGKTDAASRMIRRWSPARSLLHVADLPADVIETLHSGNVDRLVYAAAPLQVKDRCIAARLDHPQRTMLVKRHGWGGLSRTLRSVWRTSVARGCWRVSRKLEKRGIPTPRSLACVEERFGLIGYRSYLITEYIDGKSLYDFVRDESSCSSRFEDLARQVTRIWSQLVASNISHNDMKPENFIVDRSGIVWLIDLERVRFHVGGRRMKRRQLSDVRAFLHPRAWRNRADTRRVFREAFLRTTHATWLRDTVLREDSDACEKRESLTNGASRLSVLILCSNQASDHARIVRAIESTKHFADEIVVFASSRDELYNDEEETRDHIALNGRFGAQVAHASGLAPRLAKYPWILVLEAGETVSPLLAIDVEEQIAAGRAWDAFRIPIERQAFGQCVENPSRRDASPVRLLNQLCCSYSVASGALAISADPERTSELGGAIERDVCSSVAEFIARLNDDSSRAAELLYRQGKPASLRRAAFESAREFFGTYMRQGRFQHGLAGLQLSVLESLDAWLREAKLWQLNHEFRSIGPMNIELSASVGPAIVPGPGNVPAAVELPRAKAA